MLTEQAETAQNRTEQMNVDDWVSNQKNTQNGLKSCRNRTDRRKDAEGLQKSTLVYLLRDLMSFLEWSGGPEDLRQAEALGVALELVQKYYPDPETNNTKKQGNE